MDYRNKRTMLFILVVLFLIQGPLYFGYKKIFGFNTNESIILSGVVFLLCSIPVLSILVTRKPQIGQDNEQKVWKYSYLLFLATIFLLLSFLLVYSFISNKTRLFERMVFIELAYGFYFAWYCKRKLLEIHEQKRNKRK